MCLSLPHPWFAFFFCPFSLVILFIPQADFGFFLEHRPCWRCLLFPGPWGSLAVVVLSESACGSGASYLFGTGIGTAAGLSVTIVVSYTVPSFIFYFRNMWSSSLATLIFFSPKTPLFKSSSGIVSLTSCLHSATVVRSLLLFALTLFCLPSLVRVLLPDACFLFLPKNNYFQANAQY